MQFDYYYAIIVDRFGLIIAVSVNVCLVCDLSFVDAVPYSMLII